MPDRNVAPQVVQDLGCEHVLHESHCSVGTRYAGFIHGHDSCRFLTPVLQCIKAEIGSISRIVDAGDTDQSAHLPISPS